MGDADMLVGNVVVEGEIVAHSPTQLVFAGHVADRVAADGVFAAFQSRKATYTRRRHLADLHLFRSYLAEAGVMTDELHMEPTPGAA